MPIRRSGPRPAENVRRGAGAKPPRLDVTVVRQLFAAGALDRGERRARRLSPAPTRARTSCFGRETHHAARRCRRPRRGRSGRAASGPGARRRARRGADAALFEHLRALRLQLARERRASRPIMVFPDRTLIEMATAEAPRRSTRCAMVHGVGERETAALRRRFSREHRGVAGMAELTTCLISFRKPKADVKIPAFRFCRLSFGPARITIYKRSPDIAFKVLIRHHGFA